MVYGVFRSGTVLIPTKNCENFSQAHVTVRAFFYTFSTAYLSYQSFRLGRSLDTGSE